MGVDIAAFGIVAAIDGMVVYVGMLMAFQKAHEAWLEAAMPLLSKPAAQNAPAAPIPPPPTPVSHSKTALLILLIALLVCGCLATAAELKIAQNQYAQSDLPMAAGAAFWTYIVSWIANVGMRL